MKPILSLAITAAAVACVSAAPAPGGPPVKSANNADTSKCNGQFRFAVVVRNEISCAAGATNFGATQHARAD